MFVSREEWLRMMKFMGMFFGAHLFLVIFVGGLVLAFMYGPLWSKIVAGIAEFAFLVYFAIQIGLFSVALVVFITYSGESNSSGSFFDIPMKRRRYRPGLF